MVALVIGIAILTILIAAVGPSISMIMRREREEELLFRGKQYARAIVLFQKRYNRYPGTLKELYEHRPRTIRKLWKDPMCDCDDWQLLYLGQPDAIPFSGGPGGPRPGARTPVVTPTPLPFGAPGEGGGGPIVGVRSRIHKEALREWRGQSYYDEWQFIAGDADQEFRAPGTGYRAPPPPGRTPR